MNEGFFSRFVNRANRRGKKASLPAIETPIMPPTNREILLALIPQMRPFLFGEFDRLSPEFQKNIIVDLTGQKDSRMMSSQDLEDRLISLVGKSHKLNHMSVANDHPKYPRSEVLSEDKNLQTEIDWATGGVDEEADDIENKLRSNDEKPPDKIH